MAPAQCPLCDSKTGVKHSCQVCKGQFCRECCKRYLALETDPVNQVLTCNECFLEHVAWDPKRTYDVYGPEGGKTVVLVHGALIGRQCLSLEAKELAAAGYRVIVPDLPAHGARFKETPLTLDNAVSTLHEVIQQEAQGQKVVMMGFSMGGYVAAAFAAKYPELVAGVVLGGCSHDAHTWKWTLIGRMAEMVYAVCSPKTKSEFIYKSDAVNMDPQKIEIQQCFLRAGAEMDAWKYTWRVMYDADMHKLLLKITCPALVVVGERDFRSHEKVWVSLLQRGQLLVLHNGIHQFMFQPGVCQEWRARAKAFTAEAHGLKPDTDSTAANAQGADGAVSAAAGHVEALKQVDSKGQSSSAETPVLTSGGQNGVPGVGTVVANVLAQFWPQKKKHVAPSSTAGTSDGSLLQAGPQSAVA